MIAFQVKLTLTALLLPAVCSGVLFSGFILFIYIYRRTRDDLYLAMSLMGFFALVFVASEAMVLSAGGMMRNSFLGMQFHRSEQLAGAFFLFGLPFFLVYQLTLNRAWRTANKVIAAVGGVIAVAILIAAFVYPDSFISITQHSKNWLINENDYGRGQEGVLYRFRDAALGLLIIYSLICMTIDLAWHRNTRYLLPPIIGLLFAIGGALDDILHVYTGTHYVFAINTLFSRFSLGVTLYIFFCMAGLTRRFIDIAKEVEAAHEDANREAEKGRLQNDFIKNVLRKSSESTLSRADEIFATIVKFSENTQNQAAATEDVTSSIEEITAGIETVSSNAGDQNENLVSLAAVIGELSRLIVTMNDEVRDTLAVTTKISERARLGEQSLRVMNDTMGTIADSSREMTEILRIINDISDRINLLSLNAAIEAARAGDAGRGFAVVADEISKLADQTAASIKDIDRLIHTNESEITKGGENIHAAVENVVTIIRDVNLISSKISAISATMTKQLSASDVVSNNTEKVKIRSEEISNSMNEQKIATDEILKTISSINDLAQNNSLKIEKMSDLAKALVAMAEKMTKEIDGYKHDAS